MTDREVYRGPAQTVRDFLFVLSIQMLTFFSKNASGKMNRNSITDLVLHLQKRSTAINITPPCLFLLFSTISILFLPIGFACSAIGKITAQEVNIPLSCQWLRSFIIKKIKTMKRSTVIVALAMLAGISSQAQSTAAVIKADQKQLHAQEKSIKKELKEEHHDLRKLKGNEIAYASKESFFSDFGNIAGVAWRREDNFDVADFTKDGVKQSAFYDVDSKLVGVVMKKTFADLPQRAQTYINGKYKNYKKENVLLFDDNEENQTDMVMYRRPFEDADNYFIELSKGNEHFVLKCDMEGNVSYFASMK